MLLYSVNYLALIVDTETFKYMLEYKKVCILENYIKKLLKNKSNGGLLMIETYSIFLILPHRTVRLTISYNFFKGTKVEKN